MLSFLPLPFFLGLVQQRVPPDSLYGLQTPGASSQEAVGVAVAAGEDSTQPCGHLQEDTPSGPGAHTDSEDHQSTSSQVSHTQVLTSMT